MKKFYIFILVVFLNVLGAEAQLVRSRTFDEVKKEHNGYNRFTVAYDAEFFNIKADDGYSENLTGNGFNIMYNHGFGLSSTVPLYLDLGIGLGYNTGSEKEDYKDLLYKNTLSNFWVKVPLNIAYKANLTDNIVFLPYTGINFKFNGTLESKGTIYRNGEVYDEDNVNFFEDNQGGKRFQMGWQIGAGITFSNLYLGIQYGIDFMPIYKTYDGKMNTSNLAVSLGIMW